MSFFIAVPLSDWAFSAAPAAPGWPLARAFDKAQHGPDLGVGEQLLIRRHGAAIARRGMVFAPVLDEFKQPLVGMVPGVTAFIVRWGRKVAKW
jgi:hypothetical protein